jgi:hypothetical protein
MQEVFESLIYAFDAIVCSLCLDFPGCSDVDVDYKLFEHCQLFPFHKDHPQGCCLTLE